MSALMLTGPLLCATLQVMVPHIEHVLPMIPGGATFKDIITEGVQSLAVQHLSSSHPRGGRI
jgi:hypothetical protein